MIDLSGRKLTFRTTDMSTVHPAVLSVSRYRIGPYQLNRAVGFVLVTKRRMRGCVGIFHVQLSRSRTKLDCSELEYHVVGNLWKDTNSERSMWLRLLLEIWTTYERITSNQCSYMKSSNFCATRVPWYTIKKKKDYFFSACWKSICVAYDIYSTAIKILITQ